MNIDEAKQVMMDNNIQLFDFKGNRVRTLADRQGDPWFVAKDVCEVLGIANSRDAVSHLDDDEKGVANADTPGGAQNISIVSEAGLYALIGRSRKPEAKEFRRWVTHEVLPSIRKHGGYLAGQERMSPEEMLQASMRWLESRIAEQRKRAELAESQVRQLEPKARALDDFTSGKDTYSVSESAKLLVNSGIHIGPSGLFDMLDTLGWVYRRDGHWVAKQNRIDEGHLVMRAYKSHGTHTNGSRFDYAPQVRVTRKGLVLLHRRLAERQLVID